MYTATLNAGGERGGRDRDNRQAQAKVHQHDKTQTREKWCNLLSINSLPRQGVAPMHKRSTTGHEHVERSISKHCTGTSQPRHRHVTGTSQARHRHVMVNSN